MKQRISVRPQTQDTPIVKWRDVRPGTEVQAVFKGMYQGRFGPLATLETSKGSVTVPVPTALWTQLSRVRRGAEVVITYNGKRTSKNGVTTYHDFSVDVFNEADLLPEDAEAQVEPAPGGDRPIGGAGPGWPAPKFPSSPARQVEPAAEDEEDEPKPAPKARGKGKTMKSVFEGLS